jgi:unsaturated rhamnogalacturonyl hydrolase
MRVRPTSILSLFLVFLLVVSAYVVVAQARPLSPETSNINSSFNSSLIKGQRSTDLHDSRIVMLDSYFNNETKADASGNLVRWHYKWEEQGDNGFSTLASLFNQQGYQTATLYNRPSVSALKDASVYVIVDPDTKKETKKPNFIESADIKQIKAWVKGGGILLLMANDSANVELDHFNKLAGTFGVLFNKDKQGIVSGNQFEMGKIDIPANNSLFETARKIFIKEFSSLKVGSSAEIRLKDSRGHAVVATVKFGKGAVFFIGDPWLYNEYTDGKKLPKEFQNAQAGSDLIAWITKQLPKSH